MIGWLRHGQSTWNAAGRLQYGDPTPPLTELGREQARAATDALCRTTFRALISSPARRAAQTAQIVSPALGLDPLLDERLAERGRDETADSVRTRVRELLHEHGDDLLLVTHGDTIVIAVELLTGTACPLPGNAEIVTTGPFRTDSSGC